MRPEGGPYNPLVTLFRPLPRRVSRSLSVLALVAWVAQMGLLVRHVVQSSSVALASDLSRYGSHAQWKGVYSRGEKIGFMVGETVPSGDGYEIRENGQLQMTLLGAVSAASVHTAARVDRAFNLRSFEFSLDPGTGAIEVKGSLEGRLMRLEVTTPSGSRTETRELPEPPALSLNLSRRLAAEGLTPGKRVEVSVFDPATLRNAPMTLEVQEREVVWVGARPVPAFRVSSSFSGLVSTSWITDVGEVVKEESPLGFMVVRETREQALTMGVPGRVRDDLLRSSAIVPQGPAPRIDDPMTVTALRVRLDGVDLSSPDVRGGGQSVEGNEIEVRKQLRPAPEPESDLSPFLRPEMLLESDDPQIIEEAQRALREGRGGSPAEKLVRHVNDMLDKKPTVSLPSAREILRTRVGDCNEHTALYVAMARAAGIPSRIAVGVVYLQGAFYYHAWPEVYVEGPQGRGWQAVDPTFNQYPADATHIRLARGGLDRQAAILPMVGRARLKVLRADIPASAVPVLVGRPATDFRPLELPLPRREQGGGCWQRPPSR
jgi:transglutaminase-like putative cysteine protease